MTDLSELRSYVPIAVKMQNKRSVSRIVNKHSILNSIWEKTLDIKFEDIVLFLYFYEKETYMVCLPSWAK